MTNPLPSPPDTADLIVEGARQNNLKNISLRIPHNKVTAITGLSGSGKSSLAFDTLFAEGQWRYVESLSTYARMFLEKVDRPDVDRILNVRPAIAIEQKNPVRTARSTVGTATEIADLLRLLFAKIGKTVCPDCKTLARGYQPGAVADDLLTRFPDGRAMILFPIKHPEVARQQSFIQSLLTRGYTRLKAGDDIHDLQTTPTLSGIKAKSLCVLLDRLILRSDNRTRLVEAVETAFREGEGICRVAVIGQPEETYSTDFRCQSCGRRFEPVRPLLFSFNHPLGACPECKGFGNILRYDEDLIVPDRNRSLANGAIEPWSKPGSDWWQKQMLLGMKRKGISLSTPYARLSDKDRQLLWTGDKHFEGINDFFEHLEGKRYKLHVRVLLSRYRSPVSCSSCEGSRLKPEARYVRIADRDIHEASTLTVRDAADWLNRLSLTSFETEVAKDILRPLTAKLSFLERVGLGYLTLARQTKTLSGGEHQRIALANQLGSHLVGTLYVLDEPTIGLHARDTATLAGILRDLADGENTVVVVEHDLQMIRAADYLVELGPRSGEQGGEVVCAAPRDAFIRDDRPLTARYLRGEAGIPLPAKRRKGNGLTLTLTGASEHNLKHLSITLPLHRLVCVTGVSGSGKSTLVEDTLYRALARAFRIENLPMGRFESIKGLEHVAGVRLIDQQPIGRSPRSNPITYMKAFDEVRSLFGTLPDARRNGLDPSHFSFNTSGGRCERCQGTGYEKLEMYFFEDLYATCEECQGRRFNTKVLDIRYRDRTIADVLNMTVEEALTFFSGTTRLTSKLWLLSTIGLGYLRLGQSATTLSGGEAQRLKIAAELKDTTARDLVYILDEPTTGLHLDDVRKLVLVLGKLVEHGNTVVVVEHNLDLIKCADWILDLGPEGGDAGGYLVAQGTPEEVAQAPESHTGRFLKRMLNAEV